MEQDDPFAGVSHERQIELAAADEFHAGELGLEGRRDRRGSRASVGGDEVKRASVPLRRYVNDVVEPGLLRRRLDEFGLQHRLHQLLRLGVHLRLECGGDG